MTGKNFKAMSKKMLINASQHEESRVAIVEDGVLTELDIEIEGKEQSKGNIYKATVVRVEPGLQAAFVDYGADRMGFLQIGELHPNLFPKNTEGGGRPRINDILKRGQEILVQIVREERDNKGAALTTFLSLAGRYMVLMPESDTKGISRKIDSDSHRKKLKEAMAELDIPANMGYIVRTAGIGQKTAELHRDFHYLIGTYNKILDINKKGKAPQLIYRESNVVIRSIRDYFNTDMDEVLIDDPEVFREAQEFFRAVMPEYQHLLKLHQERRPIFSRYQIEDQIETLTSNKVPLPSGGSIVIDRTEALVAIDVNSGKMAGEQGIESTAFKTNLEAAAEVGRQLRLRDLGGLIVIDFIDMRERSHNREVEKVMKNALKNDKARVSVGKISQFGLLEMSRQRIRAALAEGAYRPCPHCEGSGRIKSPEAQAVAFMRRLHTSCAKGTVDKVIGKVPPDVATYLLNAKRGDLVVMEKVLGLHIEVIGDEGFTAGQIDLQIVKREKTSGAQPSGQVAIAEFSEPAPALETALTEKDDTDTPRPEQEKTDNGKRKRRRRKKAPASDTNETTVEEPTADTSDATELTTEPPAPEGEGPSETESAEAGTEKKKRRRRRRKKPAAKVEGEAPTGSPIEDMVGIAAATASEPATSPEDQPADTAAVDTPPAADPAKKPRRRRRKPAAKEEHSPAGESPEEAVAVPAGTAAAAPAASPPQPSAADDAVMTAPTEPAKKPRRRRPAAKPAAPAGGSEDATPTASVDSKTDGKEAAGDKAADSSAADTKPAAKTPRRRKPTPATVEVETDTKDQAKPARKTKPAATKKTPPADEVSADSDVKKKPVRRKKTAPENQVEQTADPTEEKPKKAVRRSRSKKAAATEDGSEQTP